MALYELAVLGKPTTLQLEELNTRLVDAANTFKLKIGSDIVLLVNPDTFKPSNRNAAAAVFYGGEDSKNIDLKSIIDTASIPILPVASNKHIRNSEIPDSLSSFNCVFYEEDGPERVFSALLSCVGLLPKQRRIFLSYRQKESTPAAIQLFNALSARQYEVFLDTHSIGYSVDFQEELWHQLCSVDVMIMLETPNYFESRWTEQEFGRALAKGIGILQVQWPDLTPSTVTGTCSRVELLKDELNTDGTFADSAIQRISLQLEQVRTLSHATRQVSMISAVHTAVNKIQGQVRGIGSHNTMYLTLRNGQEIVVQTSIGVPSATNLQSAIELAGITKSAVVYDHLGLRPSWQSHLEWLGKNVKGAKWIKFTEASYELAGYV